MQISGTTVGQFDDTNAAGVDAETMLLQLNYYRAVELARAGRYNEAEMMLQQIDKNRTLRPAIFDLRAKMFAQQGRYAEAYACWIEALSISPGNAEYSEAIEALKANAIYRPWIRLAQMMVITFAIGLIVFGAFILGLRAGTSRYEALQQRIIKLEVSGNQAATKEDIIETKEQRGAAENKLAEETIEKQQRLVLFLEDVSRQLNALTAKNEELQQTIQRQSGTISNLRGQINGVKSDLSVSADSLTQRFDSLDRQDAVTQQILREQTRKNECLLVGVAKILWAPIDLVLNIGKPHSKPEVDSAEQHKLQDNHKTGSQKQSM